MKRTLLLICTLLCANVLLAQTRFFVGDLQYEVTSMNPPEVMVYWYQNNPTNVVIPETVTYGATFEVKSIDESAFRNCSSLTSVTIPNSVTSIGASAFDNCSSLTSVTLPENITYIGENAFRNTGESSIVVINSVGYKVAPTKIPESYYATLTDNSYTISDHGMITFHIGDSTYTPTEAMVYNYNDPYGFGSASIYPLVGIDGNTYPVTSIGAVAFRDCDYLTSVYIPNSVTSIGNSAFYLCDGFTSFDIPESVTLIDNGAFADCSNLTSVNIGNSVTSIGSYAFAECSNLASVTIGNSVTTIGNYAFRDCSSLTSVTIPNSVTSIGEGAFKYCSSLTSVATPNSDTSIGTVTIGHNVTSIGTNAFYDCSHLTTLNFNAINCNVAFPFDGCPISTINIGDSVQRISDFFAANLMLLTSITIPNSVTSIGDLAFYNCISLTSITIPNSVTSIGAAVFEGCSSLTSVTLSNNITELPYYYEVSTGIAYGFFENCISLTSITIPNSVTSIGYGTFYNCSSLTSVTIPNSVTSIGNSAFGNCSSLTSIGIPNSVTTIGGWAFENCSSLNSVTCLANTPPSLGYSSFYNTPSNKILNVNCGLKDDYISSWGNAFDSNNIFEMYQYNVVATVNNEEFGSVAVENNCSTATLTATANEGYIFLNWNDGNTENPRVVSLTSDTSFVANFIISTVNTDITATICQGQTYTENGFNVSEAGIYTQTLTAINGADSIVTLTLNVNPIFNTELSATICQGQTYTENNFNVSEAGVYTQTLTSANGCDSIVTLTLNVNPIFNTELSANICQGQVYTENGFNVSEAGVYTQTLQTINGCDSIVTLTLNVNPIYNTELSATICEGQVYTENGFNVSEAGVYTQTLTSVNGCDSIVTLTLNVNPIFNTELSANICQGQVYAENGFNVSEAGVFTQTLTSVNGCDSIVTLTLNVNPVFDTTINATINAGETYASFGFNETEAGTYVQNLQTVNGCDSTITLILSVNSSLSEAEIEEISFYPNPTDSKVIFSQAIEKIEVIDLTGKVIFTFRNESEINVESLPAGAYYLRLTNNDKAVLRKLIKE